MTRERKISVYDEDGQIVVGRVHYNDDLDFWDGRNYSNGSVGHHAGLTRLTDGRYVLISGSQWEGERDTGTIITASEALQAILRSGNTDLLDRKMFQELKILAGNQIVEEMK